MSIPRMRTSALHHNSTALGFLPSSPAESVSPCLASSAPRLMRNGATRAAVRGAPRGGPAVLPKLGRTLNWARFLSNWSTFVYLKSVSNGALVNVFRDCPQNFGIPIVLRIPNSNEYLLAKIGFT